MRPHTHSKMGGQAAFEFFSSFIFNVYLILKNKCCFCTANSDWKTVSSL